MSLLQSAAYIRKQYDIPMPVVEIMDGINHTVEDFYFHTVEPKSGVLEWLKELAARDIKCVSQRKPTAIRWRHL